MPIVVSDTSPVRALQHLGLVDLLGILYGRVHVPTQVARELRVQTHRFPSFEVAAYPFFLVESPQDTARVQELDQELDPGEAEALVLALERSADRVLIDERIGRRIAHRLGLRTVGVLGILTEAKKHGHVPKVGPLISRLQAGIGFRLSTDVIAQALRDAGE